MKKNILLGLSFISLLSVILLSACSSEPNYQNFEKSKTESLTFLENSEQFRNHQGFDILLTNEEIVSCGKNCFEFDYQYSVLGDKLGYESKIQVKDNVASFISKPTALN